MNILFVHQNFPAQFKFLAPELVRQGHKVFALTLRPGLGKTLSGVRIISYHPSRSSSDTIHPWIADLETKVIRGEACLRRCLELKDSGLIPDLIIAHHGWGEPMFLKEVWPSSILALYCEFFYNTSGFDYGFDSEFSSKSIESICKLRLKNLNNTLHFDIADAGLSPTQFQANSFPQQFRSKISVIHDGIDTARIKPNPSIKLTLNESLLLTNRDEVITFVNRNLEPYRGFHIFMRTLPKILKDRPTAHVLIVGGDGVSYGAKPNSDLSWKQIFINEVRPHISDSDWDRVHFLGNLPYTTFIGLLQLSTVHIYLTYPFVLSWSLLEAMSAGCSIIASDTEPVREVIEHDRTGLLVDFFDQDALSSEICSLLDNHSKRQQISSNARSYAIDNYDIIKVCLPKQVSWVNSLLS
ncbi:Putative glycosyltransferase [Synechococcus sp. WH 8109]|uniref:glycosyltransferase family 4 protein n=1 Tax=Synechococcus sp. WH 8109 TaxID=166314 RepID=UPI0001B8DF10|nr:glycosyltransferase family 4 protein [Synechococcus sp. WH 8109]AHF62523.1 Putative glycosyltransferase [Synechococcus sp. WH 8109]